MHTAALPTDTQTLFSHGRLGACLGAIALVSLLAFEALAVAAAMPAIAAALGGLGLYAIAFGGMLATSVLGMVLAGQSCDRHGALRATVAGLAVFGAGLLVAGFAHSMAWLVAGRIVQGLGGGMLGVALYVGMGQVVPRALHPSLFAMLAAAWILPGLLGPLAAAWLVQQWGWPAVFLGVAAALPLAAALLMPALSRLPAPVRAPLHAGLALTPPAMSATPATPVTPVTPVTPTRRLAWAALAAGGALLLHAAGSAKSTLWLILAMTVGLVFACAAAARLLPSGTLAAAPGLPAVIALRGLIASAFATAEVFIPLALVRERGWTLTQAGLVLGAGAVLWSCGSAVQSRIRHAKDRRRALQAGLGVVAVGIAVVAGHFAGHLFPGQFTAHSAAHSAAQSATWVVAGWALAGFGIGLSFPMLSVLTLSLSEPTEQGHNASALQISDALCSSAALAVAGALFNLAGDRGPQGYVLVLALAAALALVAALLGRRAFA